MIYAFKMSFQFVSVLAISSSSHLVRSIRILDITPKRITPVHCPVDWTIALTSHENPR